jgi:hypothetical protein
MIDLNTAQDAVAAFQQLLDKTPTRAAAIRISPDAWTLAEIVGHLIDSASNNHQRFARLRLGNLEGFPGYETQPWVAAQHYASSDFKMLANLWTSYNAFLLHLAETTPPWARRNVWITSRASYSLEFLITDYFEHLTTHTDHYAERLAEIECNMCP